MRLPRKFDLWHLIAAILCSLYAGDNVLVGAGAALSSAGSALESVRAAP